MIPFFTWFIGFVETTDKIFMSVLSDMISVNEQIGEWLNFSSLTGFGINTP